MRNRRLADQLWTPHPDRGSYSNVYSLRDFRPADIPYEEIWDLPGFNVGDNFMGARFLDGDKADELLDGLHIVSGTSVEMEAAEAAQLVARADVRFVPGEAVNVLVTTAHPPTEPLVVRRLEAQLVRAYSEWLDVPTQRIRCTAGVTDLVINRDDGLEVIEAKAAISRGAVRTGIGQVLDYFFSIPDATHMSLLLPAEPAPDLASLCLRLGIAVIHPEEAPRFVRREPDDAAQSSIRALLSNV